MSNIFLVSVGAALGAPLRFWIDNHYRPIYRFPIGIMISNVVGSFLIGLFVNANQSLFALFAIGFCGSLTTWSTLVMDTYFGFQNKLYGKTIANFFGSLLFGWFALQIGLTFGQ